MVAAIGVDALDEREGTAGLPQYGSGTVAVLNIGGMNDDAQQEAQGIDEDMTLASLLVLVDELAHSNAPGTRNPKRYLDVEELLAAGIDVYTTLNIQRVDSLNDVVARITRIRVRETAPDSILDRADDIEVVDLAPDEPRCLWRARRRRRYRGDPDRRAGGRRGRRRGIAASSTATRIRRIR